ncbi:MAG TPA: hypothetical protein VKZ96_11745 [Thermomicrobiales bacterium]|nr:hypothetical protein [Thermomicrobiales bacterium]
MISTTSRATRPLSSEQPRDDSHGHWRVASAATPHTSFEAAPLASYVCDCNERTLFQIQRTADLDAPVQLVLTCSWDGHRVSRAFRRMPWVVELELRHRERAVCRDCGSETAELQVFDGLVVGVRLACPLCGAVHSVDLALGALPVELRLTAFGMEPPRAVLSPPVYAVLRMMWECVQRKPTNAFRFTPYTIRDDCGILRHDATGLDTEVDIDHLSELLTAGLIEDGDLIAISKPGVIVCLREFGRR